MIKRLIILILGIYIGAFLGLDRINKATVYCVEGVKSIYSTMKQAVETGENNEQV